MPDCAKSVTIEPHGKENISISKTLNSNSSAGCNSNAPHRSESRDAIPICVDSMLVEQHCNETKDVTPTVLTLQRHMVNNLYPC